MELQLKNYKELKEKFKNNNTLAESKHSLLLQLQNELIYLQQDQIVLTGKIIEVEEITGKTIQELDKLLKEYENGNKDTYPDNVIPIHDGVFNNKETGNTTSTPE